MQALVLDLETAIDRGAAERANRTAAMAASRIWLHRIIAVSVFRFTFDPSRIGFADLGLHTSLALDPDEEPALLHFVEQQVEAVGAHGTLITFNGLAHDLPLLAHRRLRHWQFEASHLRRFNTRSARTHIDLMLEMASEGTRWPALADLSAAHGIPHDVRQRRAAVFDPSLVKSQVDVLGTFLLWCLWTSGSGCSSTVYERGWTAVGDYLLQRFPQADHLTQFATAPMALAARQRAMQH